MDSMNKLQGSLPISSTKRNAVLAPFRETACSLTAFFKTASAEIDRAYSDGARSALERLLGAMDHENLGLQEGEGWRVRQLIMNIYGGLQSEASNGESASQPEPELETEETEKPISLSSSPIRINERQDNASSVEANPVQNTVSCKELDDSALRQGKSSLPSMDFTFAAPYPSANFESRQLPTSPYFAMRTPPLRPTSIDSWNVSGLNVLGPGAGIKRRSKSPSDLSGPSAPSTPKRIRRHNPDEQ